MSVQTAARAADRAADERALVAVVALAAMLAPLNSTMIAVALPQLAADMGAGAGSAWLVTSGDLTNYDMVTLTDGNGTVVATGAISSAD